MQRKATRDETRIDKKPFGWALAGIGMVSCAPIGAYFVSVATGFVGIILGIVVYTLGDRRLGLLTFLVCTAAMYFRLLMGQGVIPDSHDRVVDGVFRSLGRVRG